MSSARTSFFSRIFSSSFSILASFARVGCVVAFSNAALEELLLPLIDLVGVQPVLVAQVRDRHVSDVNGLGCDGLESSLSTIGVRCCEHRWIHRQLLHEQQ